MKRVLSLAVAAVLTLPAVLQAQGFGQSVAVGDDAVFVGESLNATEPGFVYVFARGSSGWARQEKLQASDAAANDHFGRFIAELEGTLIIGATVARNSLGAAYVFQRSETGAWVEQAILLPSDGVDGDNFGRMGATDGARVAVSTWGHAESRGAVYIYGPNASGEWAEEAKLMASDAAANDWFGRSLALDGDRILVGASVRNNSQGAVYAFQRAADGTWAETQILTAPDAENNLNFGTALALDGDRALVGAPGRAGFIGGVYPLLADEMGAWSVGNALQPFDGAQQGTQFGSSLLLQDGEAWIGAPGAASFEGRIYRLMSDASGEWTGAVKLATAGLNRGDNFGAVMTAAGPLAVVGLTGSDFGLGSAVVLERQGEMWATTGIVVGDDAVAPDAIVGGDVKCAQGAAASFDCSEMDIVSFLPVRDIGGARGVQVNDVWGWTDPVSGVEYAIVGRYEGTSFISLADPSNPTYVGDLPMTAGSQANVWRDIKVYRDHAYIVADNAGSHGMQVFDLTQLRDVRDTPVTFAETAHYDGIHSAHNIVINEETGFAYAVGSSSGGESCGGGLHMIDLNTPARPTFAGCFQDMETGQDGTGYSHDAQCVQYHGPDQDYQGREICLGANETALSIADVTDKASPLAIANASYPNVAYAHQGWFDEGHQYFYMNDEGDETAGTVEHTRTLIWDLTDLDDPVLAGEYFSDNAAIDHNLYIKDNLMYQSNYLSGLRVIDITDRVRPVEVGFLDTVGGENTATFDGSWSNYPFFASGIIVVTSGREGVFFLKKADRRLIP